MKKAPHLPPSLLLSPLLSLFLLASGAATAADDATVLKCRALPDSAQRLACYDAMPVGAAPLVASPAAASTAPAPALAAAPARAAEQNFGMEKAAKKQEPEYLESSIVGDFDGWEGNTRITLANGQVWRIVDGSTAVLPQLHNPKVRIKRGMFGALYFQVVGQNNMARVRREQ
ncbi:hypothetical protein ACSUZJ_12600 [Telluria sp. B2]